MTKDDDTAALIAEAQAWVKRSRFEWANHMPPGVMPPEHASLIARLAAALERAQQDAARMREASGALLRAVDDYGVKHWDVDDFPPLVQAIVDASHEVRRAALEPRP